MEEFNRSGYFTIVTKKKEQEDEEEEEETTKTTITTDPFYSKIENYLFSINYKTRFTFFLFVS